MEQIFTFFLMVLFFGVIGLFFYKYRQELRRWLSKGWYPSRETVLRRRIEDAEAEIDWLNEKEPNGKE